MENVLEKLERLIDAAGLNPTRLARLTGVPQSSLHDMLKGKRRITFEALVRVAKVLGVSLDYLADDEATEPPAPLTEAQKWAVDFIGDKEMSRKDVVRRLTIDPAIVEMAPLRPNPPGRKARS